MKIFIKIFFLAIFIFPNSNADANNIMNDTGKFIKFGVFDFKHQTDMFALGVKKVTNNNIELPYLGELTQIYDLILMTDLDESLTHDNQSDTNKREEYGIYFSSGLQKKLDLSEKLFFLPSFSIGFYNEFDQGKDMGFPIEFKSEIELNFKSSNNFIYGVTYSHISNADIGSKNPGSDSILIGFRYNK